METWDPATQNWTVVRGADKDFSQLYPSLHLLPGGEYFYSRTGWNPQSGTDAAKLVFTGTNAGTWTDGSPMQFPDRQEGAAVVLIDASMTPPAPRILVAGGGVTGTNNPQSAEIIDVTTLAPVPAWTRRADMSHKRTNVNGVVLPDGTVLVVGGQRNGKWAGNPDPVFATEIYDPDADTWTPTAPLNFPKQYHSIAVLLPDGACSRPAASTRRWAARRPRPAHDGGLQSAVSVQGSASGGDGGAGHDGLRGHVHDHDARRPGHRVGRARAPGAMTHHTDGGQRYVRLGIAGAAAGSITVNTPADGRVAPPGFYMLFVVNTAGVPSVARWVRLV